METSDSVHPLSQFPIVNTSRLDEARDTVTRVYLPHRLDSADGDQLRMTLNAAEAARFTVGFLAYGAKTRLDMPPTENSYHINLTTKGKTFASRGDGSRAVTAADSSGLVLLPDQLNTVRWTADAEQLILKVPRWRLESHLADLIGHRVEEVIDFDFHLDLTTLCGRSLLSAVEFMARELDRPGGIAEMPIAREQLETFVLTELLSAVPTPIPANWPPRGHRAPVPAHAGDRVHGDERRRGAHPAGTGAGGLHERAYPARHVPGRTRRLVPGLPAPPAPGPRSGRAPAGRPR